MILLRHWPRVWALLALASSTAVVGCAAQTIPVDPMLWKQPHPRIAIAFVSLPQAGTFKEGGQGLIDVAINAAMASDLDKHLGGLAPATFQAVVARFERRLQQFGFETKRVPQPLRLETLPFREKEDPQYFDRDVSALAAKIGVDAILLLAIDRWGTTRPYYGFIPLGAPSGLCQVRGQLIDRDGRLRWRIANPGPDSTVAVEGDWDQPPTFPNLTRAVAAAQVKSAAFLEASFFEGAPPPPPRAREPRPIARPEPPATPPVDSPPVPGPPAAAESPPSS